MIFSKKQTVFYYVLLFIFINLAQYANAKDEDMYLRCKNMMYEYISTLNELVNIDSPTREYELLKIKKQYIVQALKDLTPHVETIQEKDERNNCEVITARFDGKGRQKILVACHYDTVWPVGESARRPFHIENNIAYGPGVFDDQQAVAASLVLAKMLPEISNDFATVTLLFNSGEEIGSANALDILTAQASLHDAVLSMEAGGADGEEIIISSRGTCNAVITVEGVSAHAGRPSEGKNAGLELARQMIRISESGVVDKENFTDANWTVGSFGKAQNAIPGTATALMNIRAAKASEFERVKALVEESCAHPFDPGCKVNLDFQYGRGAFEFNEAVDKLASCAETIFSEELGRKLTRVKHPSGSDAITFSQVAPTLEGLGMGGGAGHRVDEYVALKNVPDRLYLILRLIQEVGKGAVVF